jgi:hypothetical protein
MMQTINQVIQKNLNRALTAVVTRHNIKMDTSIYNEIWETMLSEAETAAPEVEVAESVAGSVENTKLTPLQRAEKQVTTTTEKLDKIRARQGTAKQTQKQKEKDPEDIRKLEEKLKEATAKLEKLAPAPVAATAPTPAPEKKVNMAKWTPTWKKHYEAAGNKPEQKEEFMQYINAMTETVYNASSYEAHTKAFANVKAPAAPVPEPAADEEVTEVEYDGETYVVGDVSGKVWKVDEETEVDIPVHDLDTIKAVTDKLKNSK